MNRERETHTHQYFTSNGSHFLYPLTNPVNLLPKWRQRSFSLCTGWAWCQYPPSIGKYEKNLMKKGQWLLRNANYLPMVGIIESILVWKRDRARAANWASARGERVSPSSWKQFSISNSNVYSQSMRLEGTREERGEGRVERSERTWEDETRKARKRFAKVLWVEKECWKRQQNWINAGKSLKILRKGRKREQTREEWMI